MSSERIYLNIPSPEDLAKAAKDKIRSAIVERLMVSYPDGVTYNLSLTLMRRFSTVLKDFQDAGYHVTVTTADASYIVKISADQGVPDVVSNATSKDQRRSKKRTSNDKDMLTVPTSKSKKTRSAHYPG